MRSVSVLVHEPGSCLEERFALLVVPTGHGLLRAVNVDQTVNVDQVALTIENNDANVSTLNTTVDVPNKRRFASCALFRPDLCRP